MLDVCVDKWGKVYLILCDYLIVKEIEVENLDFIV